MDGKSSQEYPVNAGVPQGSILDPTLFLLYTDDLPNAVICNISIYADDTTVNTSFRFTLIFQLPIVGLSVEYIEISTNVIRSELAGHIKIQLAGYIEH